jgi:hypothetical protein
MKFCLRSRQTAEYLNKADEIKVEYRDRKSIPDLAEKFPHADIILELPPQVEWSLTEIKSYKDLTKGKLICQISHINDQGIPFLKENDIPFYWGYEITSPIELHFMKELGVCYVIPGGPIFFNTKLLREFGIPARVTPNIANPSYLPDEFGTVGTWIRPENLYLYEDVVAAVEFGEQELKREQALFRIYAEQKNWPGPLNMIVENLGAEPVNRMLPPEITYARLNCEQKCLNHSHCTLCHRYFNLANEEMMRSYVKEVLNKDEETVEE